MLRFYLSIHSNLIFVKIFIYGPLTKAAPSSGRQCLPAHGGKRQVLLTGNSIYYSALRRMSENDLGVNIGMF